MGGWIGGWVSMSAQSPMRNGGSGGGGEHGSPVAVGGEGHVGHLLPLVVFGFDIAVTKR